ncbi:TrmH family RNA methyltransferase [Amorphus orientalis]|uniref:tRNA G18 (Ribose-2'-O)-methylase SpoU n=1 Tax=Amorphus orientalis TaxID=649198 RepID=A0AAE4AUP5_9HYPH|nr:RNA methyltransferase [Amorphus orientalis]MDQ0317367.1 tRNA G18 (ribose-2'-O)-methylase SpoU [Amorphus orientalis]
MTGDASDAERFVEIDDPDDPRIEAYRAIRERDLVGRDESFIAEGAVVLDVLLRLSRFRPQSLLVAENRKDAALTLLAETGTACPVYVASKPVLDAIAGFNIHRGLLAHGHRGPLPDWQSLVPPPDRPALLVVLVGLANHDNVGGVFRNAAAFGADAVLIDSTTCDPLYRKAIRVSVGGSLTVPFARFSDIGALCAHLDDAAVTSLGLATSGSEELAHLVPPQRAAVFLGAEGPGLPDRLLSRIRTVRIPMAANFDSLNVATTAGIALHHLRSAPVRPAQ